MINPSSEGFPVNAQRELVFSSESIQEIGTDPLDALSLVLKNPPQKMIHASKNFPHNKATRNATVVFSRFRNLP